MTRRQRFNVANPDAVSNVMLNVIPDTKLRSQGRWVESDRKVWTLANVSVTHFPGKPRCNTVLVLRFLYCWVSAFTPHTIAVYSCHV